MNLHTRPALKALLIRIGCIPPDTPFNRRAAAYVKASMEEKHKQNYAKRIKNDKLQKRANK
jgi:hypothetical protein